MGLAACPACCQQVSDEDLQAILALLDADKDGAISCADFAAIDTPGSSGASSGAQGAVGASKLSAGS
jgi:hypothetical protein